MFVCIFWIMDLFIRDFISCMWIL